MAASRARSTGESLASSAASFASESPWSAAASPSPCSRLPVAGAMADCGDGRGRVQSGPSPLPFSGLLVQTLVQIGEGVGATSCGFASCNSPALDCRSGGCGFDSRRPRTQGPLTVVVSGSFLLSRQALAAVDAVTRSIAALPGLARGAWSFTHAKAACSRSSGRAGPWGA